MNLKLSYSPEMLKLGQNVFWPLLPWLFAWTSLLSMLITPENFVMTWWQQKGVTDGQMHWRRDRWKKVLLEQLEHLKLWHNKLYMMDILSTIMFSTSMFYLKFSEHPSFGQLAHEIYPSEWKVYSSEISLIICIVDTCFDDCSNRFDPCDLFN